MSAVPRTKLYIADSELFKATLKLFFSGPAAGCPVEEFEKVFAANWNRKTAVAGPYARMCFYAALNALRLPENSEIITTPITIHDIINVISISGSTPVFVDIDPLTCQMDPDKLEAAITTKTKAVLLTHLFGMPSDMKRIMSICERHSLTVLEDVSHSFGASLDGTLLGNFGKVGFFSLSSLKTVSAGYGGIMVSDDEAILDDVRSFFNSMRSSRRKDLQDIMIKNLIIAAATNPVTFNLFAFPLIRLLNLLNPQIVQKLQTDNPDRFLLTNVPDSWKFRFSPLQAELAMATLSRMAIVNEKRRSNAEMLYSALAPVASSRMPKLLPDSYNVFWRFPLRMPEGIEFQRFMNRHSIDTTTTLLPCCNVEPVFKKYYRPAPYSEQLVKEIYFLPVEPQLNEKKINGIANAVSKFLKAGT